jgi:hypothetical protein
VIAVEIANSKSNQNREDDAEIDIRQK